MYLACDGLKDFLEFLVSMVVVFEWPQLWRAMSDMGPDMLNHKMSVSDKTPFATYGAKSSL